MISILSTLPDEVDQLINVLPTRAALDAYLGSPRKRTDRPRITNVFASPKGTPAIRAAYDLCDHLADWRDELLLPSGLTADRLDDVGPAERQKIEELDYYRTMNCNALFQEWACALAGYEGMARDPHWSQARLYLEPFHRPLPTLDVLSKLCAQQAILHLILLTARHELGYLLEKARAGEQWRLPAGGDLGGQGLSRDDLALLDARIRGHYYQNGREVGRDKAEACPAAPGLVFAPASDLANAYKLMRDWCRAS